MPNQLFLCADIGTSSLKAAVIDSSGSLHAFTRIPFTNADAASWLFAFKLAAEQLSAALPLSPPVSALVISGNGPTLVPVDGDDPLSSNALRPLYWYDPAPRLAGFSSLFLPKVKIFAETEPRLFAGTRFLFSSQEWLSWKLGARPVTVIPHNGYIPYYWDDEECELFPPYVTMGNVIGEFNPAVFTQPPFAQTPFDSKLLLPGTPLIAGAADFIMALIGTGTLEPGKANDRTGSSEGINLCLAKDDAAKDITNINSSFYSSFNFSRLRLLPHAIEGLWNLSAVIPRSGILFDEYRTSSGQSEKPYNELAQEIFAHASHPGMAVLETMGRAFVKALNDFEACGYSIKELTLSGGQCANSLWNKYKAGISGRVLKVPEIIHAELAGNAVLAAAALEGGTLQEKAATMIRIKETVPNRQK